MTVFYFFAMIILVSVIVSILIAQLVANAALIGSMGAFSTGLLGVAGCFALATAIFFLFDPDPVSGQDAPLARLMRNLPITGLSAIIWLPIFTTVFNRLRRKRQTG